MRCDGAGIHHPYPPQHPPGSAGRLSQHEDLPLAARTDWCEKRLFFEPVVCKADLFTNTGSGRTEENAEQRDAFLAGFSLAIGRVVELEGQGRGLDWDTAGLDDGELLYNIMTNNDETRRAFLKKT